MYTQIKAHIKGKGGEVIHFNRLGIDVKVEDVLKEVLKDQKNVIRIQMDKHYD